MRPLILSLYIAAGIFGCVNTYVNTGESEIEADNKELEARMDTVIGTVSRGGSDGE